MPHLTRRAALTALIGGTLASTATLAQHRFRVHTATARSALDLTEATRNAGRNKVSIRTLGGKRIITSNGIPNHAVGQFPNRGNPHEMTAQSHRFEMPLSPQQGRPTALAFGTLTGVAINGVPFDPGAAEFWQGNPRSGWQYEALGGAVALGLDANYGHVQPSGAYHYHGLPIGLLQTLGWSASRPSPLVGYAADGFPIYALMAETQGQVVEMTSSYRLKSGTRRGSGGPKGAHDGTFVQDYQYVAGAGTLDAANGAFVTTSDYPGGTYAYFLTRSFPVIPRMLSGPVDRSFSKRTGTPRGNPRFGQRPPRSAGLRQP
ncbi:MAG: YHYH protein [Pseudomonadota bacterium]